MHTPATSERCVPPSLSTRHHLHPQCPLEAGGVSSYVFTVDVPGTYFYHSHVGLQMDLGLVGPLIVVDPADPHR